MFYQNILYSRVSEEGSTTGYNSFLQYENHYIQERCLRTFHDLVAVTLLLCTRQAKMQVKVKMVSNSVAG